MLKITLKEEKNQSFNFLQRTLPYLSSRFTYFHRLLNKSLIKKFVYDDRIKIHRNSFFFFFPAILLKTRRDLSLLFLYFLPPQWHWPRHPGGQLEGSVGHTPASRGAGTVSHPEIPNKYLKEPTWSRYMQAPSHYQRDHKHMSVCGNHIIIHGKSLWEVNKQAIGLWTRFTVTNDHTGEHAPF